MILQTKRLFLRELCLPDWDSLSAILQDSETMYAYEHPFSNEEVHAWLERQIERYRQYGFGLWAVVEKISCQMIGQCGLTWQDVHSQKVLEIGYLFQKQYWHQGFATEAAIACKKYAFEKLGVEEVFSIIRKNNIPSQKVALRNGMRVCGKMVQYYYGMEMPHLIFRVMRDGGDSP